MIRTVPGSGGWLEVVCGPMFSGKSEELIRRLRRAEIAGQRVLIVKPRIDDRFDVSHVVSHAGAKMRAICMRCGAPASRTQRLVASSERVVVGAAGLYEARCRRCFEAGIAPVDGRLPFPEEEEPQAREGV